MTNKLLLFSHGLFHNYTGIIRNLYKHQQSCDKSWIHLSPARRSQVLRLPASSVRLMFVCFSLHPRPQVRNRNLNNWNSPDFQLMLWHSKVLQGLSHEKGLWSLRMYLLFDYFSGLQALVDESTIWMCLGSFHFSEKCPTGRTVAHVTSSSSGSEDQHPLQGCWSVVDPALWLPPPLQWLIPENETANTNVTKCQTNPS